MGRPMAVVEFDIVRPALRKAGFDIKQIQWLDCSVGTWDDDPYSNCAGQCLKQALRMDIGGYVERLLLEGLRWDPRLVEAKQKDLKDELVLEGIEDKLGWGFLSKGELQKRKDDEWQKLNPFITIQFITGQKSPSLYKTESPNELDIKAESSIGLHSKTESSGGEN
ncbi:hypothetical protein F5Y10DRAFT_228982 [Nemania abortiva]|nr:hypothetical protein F5Y10DRAFT_228982 [Nemania abortiva]